jgi:hypothetical protein
MSGCGGGCAGRHTWAPDRPNMANWWAAHRPIPENVAFPLCFCCLSGEPLCPRAPLCIDVSNLCISRMWNSQGALGWKAGKSWRKLKKAEKSWKKLKMSWIHAFFSFFQPFSAFSAFSSFCQNFQKSWSPLSQTGHRPSLRPLAQTGHRPSLRPLAQTGHRPSPCLRATDLVLVSGPQT